MKSAGTCVIVVAGKAMWLWTARSAAILVVEGAKYPRYAATEPRYKHMRIQSLTMIVHGDLCSSRSEAVERANIASSPPSFGIRDDVCVEIGVATSVMYMYI